MKNIKIVNFILGQFDTWIRDQGVPVFIFIMIFMSFIVVVPVSVVASFGTNSIGYSRPVFSGNSLSTIFIVCMVAPLLETFMYQWLPLRLLGRMRNISTWQCVVLSAMIFGAAHWYSLYYIFYAFMTGLVFAYAFIICDATGSNSYIHVSIIHSLRNLVTFGILLMIK